MVTTKRKRRSEPLTKEEHKALIKYVGSFFTKSEAAEEIGISRVSLHGILNRGTGKTEIIERIREKLTA